MYIFFLFFVSLVFFVGETQLELYLLLLFFYATDSWLRNISSKHTMGSNTFLIFRKQCSIIVASKSLLSTRSFRQMLCGSHIKIWISWKKWNKEHQTLSFQFFTNKFSILMFLFCFFMWFAFGASFLYWVDFRKMGRIY